ncbi:LemA family protein [Filifactor alocis]
MIKFVLVIIAIMLIWGVSIRNRLKQYLVVIDESKESVDIALEKRYDTIFEMMKIAKAYAKHEEKVFTEVVRLRQGLSMKETNDVIRSQNRAISEIFAVAENYPELLSSQQFLNLQNQVVKENSALSAAKRIVNSNISALNKCIVSFPMSIVAYFLNLDEMEFLEIDIEEKKSISGFDYAL